MQEIIYRTPEGEKKYLREFFDGANNEEVWDKMRNRFRELEKEKDIIAVSRTLLTKNQAKRLRKKENV